MNKQFERRLRRLEQRQHTGTRRKKRVVPEWLLELWHEDSGLPFDTDEQVMDSLQPLQQPAYQPKFERVHSRCN